MRMREIKFRGYDGMDWLYGSAVQYDKDTDTWYMIEGRGPDDDWMMVGEVGQYTGLKDKNGVEIFEGDIISFLDAYCESNEDGQGFEEFANRGVIEYSSKELRFYVTNKQSVDDEEIFEGEVVVISNIYENPELLES